MIFRLIGIAFVFICTAIAWAVLGTTIQFRTESSTASLRDRVQSVWGAPQVQTAPFAEYTDPPASKRPDKPGITHTLRPWSSEVAVAIQYEPRKKGLLWYSTYSINFQGDYKFRAPQDEEKAVRLALRLPADRAEYDDLRFTVDNEAVDPFVSAGIASVVMPIAAGQTRHLHIAYRSQGLDSWGYSFGDQVNLVRNFHLRMTTNFHAIDFPDNTLAPASKRPTRDGWELDWNYQNLLSGYRIAMTMPAKLQPGPLASQISFFAPVSLFFFFFALFIISTSRDIELHPMNYFFLAAAFFAFHLLLAYLVDHLDVRVSFAIASVVSVALVVTYLRLVVGIGFAAREAGIAQLVYLVLFSSAFFFQGYTGLSITLGAIATLFVAMQMSGRIRWAEKFSIRKQAPPIQQGA